MILSNRLKFCRQNMNFTQKEMGKIFNVSLSTISGWENGYDDIPLKKLSIFCNKFNYSIDYILYLSNNNIHYTNCNINQKNIGNNLKIIRKSKNLTQQNIADLLKISRSCYCQYELGINIPTTTFLYSFAMKFNVSIDKILDRKKISD